MKFRHPPESVQLSAEYVKLHALSQIIIGPYQKPNNPKAQDYRTQSRGPDIIGPKTAAPAADIIGPPARGPKIIGPSPAEPGRLGPIIPLCSNLLACKGLALLAR